MFQTISIVAVTLRHQHAVQTSPTFERSLPLLADSNNTSPPGWAQNWAHELFNAANPSSNSTFARSFQLALGAGGRRFESGRPDHCPRVRCSSGVPPVVALSVVSLRFPIYRRRRSPKS